LFHPDDYKMEDATNVKVVARLQQEGSCIISPPFPEYKVFKIYNNSFKINSVRLEIFIFESLPLFMSVTICQ